MRARWAASLLLAVLWMAAGCGAPERPARSVTVFAAASLQTVIETLAPAILDATGVTVRASYAASSALARQIEEGAPADLFISADRAWMDYLETRGAVRSESRANLLGNRLVLVAPAGLAPSLTIAPGVAVVEALGAGRLAVADPAAVPAGRYAREALESLGIWRAVVSRLAPAENVRAALLLVARGEAPLGIVYRSDAIADPRVVTVDTFPADSHSPIVYPAAVTAAAPSAEAAAEVLRFLHGAEARKMFVEQGFDLP